MERRGQGTERPPLEAPLDTLREIVRRCGTPTYAYDLGHIRFQAERLRANLPGSIGLFYSLKANPSLGLCAFLAGCGMGADVASAGELFTALEAGFPPGQIFVSGPYQSAETLTCLRSFPAALLSVDSISELQRLAALDLRCRVLLRLRPDFDSAAAVATGPGSRFGIRLEDLPRCRKHLADGGIDLVGFHVFCGSQVLNAADAVRHLRGAANLCLRGAEALAISPEILNLGGGFGIPYRPDDPELDLAPVADHLRLLLTRVSPARIVLELGRYLVAAAGWYLTTVVGRQTHAGRAAVVVDGGTHQRADLCGLGLRSGAFPPLSLSAAGGSLLPTDVLGCLSAPGDVLAESALLPPLSPGETLAFRNAGAYGLAASPFFFHGSPAPAEVAFDGGRIDVIRSRQPARSVLEGQVPLRDSRPAPIETSDAIAAR
jgi:diaminopimelate decarboxylase